MRVTVDMQGIKPVVLRNQSIDRPEGYFKTMHKTAELLFKAYTKDAVKEHVTSCPHYCANHHKRTADNTAIIVSSSSDWLPTILCYEDGCTDKPELFDLDHR